MSQESIPVTVSPSHRRLAFLEQACGPVRVSTEAPLRTTAPLIAVVSSTLGHDRSLHRGVCRRLSRAALDCRDRGGTLLVASGSAIEPWAQRAAELFAVRRLGVSVNAEPSNDGDGVRIESSRGRKLSRDQTVIALADRVDGLFVRRGGTIERCLAERLRIRDDASTRVAISGDPRCAAARLIAEGAIGWYLLPASEHLAAQEPPTAVPETNANDPAIAFWPQWTRAAGEWLVHCTRASEAEWPGQTHRQYLDSLLLGGEPPASADAFETLRRIVKSGRLVAAAGASSRSHPVVCFSAVPLAELLPRRCYRPHLHRWDYEPYGIAVQLRAAATAGATPVIYGDRQRRRELPAGDRYRFQARGHTYDWTQEREWRSPADVDLNQFDPCTVRVFVPSAAEAAALAPLCRWSISVVPGE